MFRVGDVLGFFRFFRVGGGSRGVFEEFGSISVLLILYWESY